MSEPIVSIRTGARLHFGPLSFRPATGRHFGGIGMMIEQPGVRLTARLLDDRHEADIAHSRAAEYARRVGIAAGLEFRPLQLLLDGTIPPHRGLGSGTQLALAVAEAVLRLHGRPSVSARELALLTGRGVRSAVGLSGYEAGGFLIDAGHRAGEALGELACRLDVPPDWRVLIVTPPDAEGVHGPEEQRIFDRLPGTGSALEGELARLTLTEILPALRHADFPAFSEALFEYGARVGRFFSGSQAGIFADERMTALAAALREEGVRGIAQSSWGPAIALFCRDDSHADAVREFCRDHPLGADCPLLTTRARNSGRSLTLDRVGASAEFIAVTRIAHQPL